MEADGEEAECDDRRAPFVDFFCGVFNSRAREDRVESAAVRECVGEPSQEVRAPGAAVDHDHEESDRGQKRKGVNPIEHSSRRRLLRRGRCRAIGA